MKVFIRVIEKKWILMLKKGKEEEIFILKMFPFKMIIRYKL